MSCVAPPESRSRYQTMAELAVSVPSLSFELAASAASALLGCTRFMGGHMIQSAARLAKIAGFAS